MAGIVLGYETALFYLRHPLFDRRATAPRACGEPQAKGALARAEVLPSSRFRREDVLASVATAGLPDPPTPVHLLVATRAARRQSTLFEAHVWGGRLPSEALIELNTHTHLSSPSFVFLQMAAKLSVPRLALLGCELCGTYALAEGERGFRDRDALESAAGIGRSLADIQRVRGVRTAREAAGCLLDGAASPMESVVALLLSLPIELGGYGLARPRLNCRIDPALGARAGAPRDWFACDLYWPQGRVAVEYDSDAFHTGGERIARDSERRNALAYLGITVVTVTRRQVMDGRAMDRVAVQLRRLLGMPALPDTAEIVRRRLRLRDELLPRRRPA